MNKASKKAVKNPQIIEFFAEKDKYLAFKVNKSKEEIIYNIRGTQSKNILRVIFRGFQELPSGIYFLKSGYGFNGASGGRFIMSYISDISSGKPTELIILKDGSYKIKNLSSRRQITIPISEIKNAISDIKKISFEKKQEINLKLADYFGTSPAKNTSVKKYAPGELESMLKKEDLFEGLSEGDIVEIGDFIPKFFKSDLSKKIKKQKEYKLQIAKMSKNQSEKVYLDEVISEYEHLLSKKLSEQKWQDFLREKVFPFLSNYKFFIEKEKVSLRGVMPDFIAIDIYDFIDIYEIKTPQEEIFTFDNVHKNYYWKSEVSKAISQIEAYIDEVNDNPAKLEKYIKETHGKEIKVIRPRGYIIFGKSTEFTDNKQFNDFRRLSRSLKNIDFILYDELLESLKNLRSKL